MSWIFLKRNQKVRCSRCESIVALAEADTYINSDFYDEGKGAFIQCPCGNRLSLAYLMRNGVSLIKNASSVRLIETEPANGNKISVLNLN